MIERNFYISRIKCAGLKQREKLKSLLSGRRLKVICPRMSCGDKRNNFQTASVMAGENVCLFVFIFLWVSRIDGLQAFAKDKVSDSELQDAKTRFPHNTPKTKEAYLIRYIFESHFPQIPAIESVPGGPSVACSTAAAIAWDASFTQFAGVSFPVPTKKNFVSRLLRSQRLWCSSFSLCGWPSRGDFLFFFGKQFFFSEKKYFFV